MSRHLKKIKSAFRRWCDRHYVDRPPAARERYYTGLAMEEHQRKLDMRMRRGNPDNPGRPGLKGQRVARAKVFTSGLPRWNKWR